MSQRPPNTEAKVSGVGIHKSRRNATIATMPVNARQFMLTHFPRLLQNLTKNSVEHDFSWMVAVKVDFHLLPPWFAGVVGTAKGVMSKTTAGLPAPYAFKGQVQFQSSGYRPLSVAFAAERFFSGVH
jgi:hypothetical protein